MPDAVKGDSHIDGKGHAPTPSKEPNPGAVRLSHLNRLGKADGMTNPNGVGNVSKKSTVQNGGSKGW